MLKYLVSCSKYESVDVYVVCGICIQTSASIFCDRKDLVHVDHVMCVVSGPPLKYFYTGSVLLRLKCWAYTAGCIVPWGWDPVPKRVEVLIILMNCMMLRSFDVGSIAGKNIHCMNTTKNAYIFYQVIHWWADLDFEVQRYWISFYLH
jgi:hypothetical protein